MINYKHLCVFDFETTGKSPKTAEITQIAAVIVSPRDLAIVDTFDRDYIAPQNWDLVEKEALVITGKDEAKLRDGIHPKQAWADFASFMGQYNKTKSAWNAPIPGGYNIDNYDMPILNRYCELYGPIDKKRNSQSLVSSFMSFDLMKEIHWWFESCGEQELPDLKLTTVAQYMGLPIAGAHNALVDTKICAKIIIKMLRLRRLLKPKIKMKDAFLGGEY